MQLINKSSYNSVIDNINIIDLVSYKIDTIKIEDIAFNYSMDVDRDYRHRRFIYQCNTCINGIYPTLYIDIKLYRNKWILDNNSFMYADNQYLWDYRCSY